MFSSPQCSCSNLNTFSSVQFSFPLLLLYSWQCLVLFFTANLNTEKAAEDCLCHRSLSDLKFDMWAKNEFCFIARLHWKVPPWACCTVWFLLVAMSHSSAFKMSVHAGNISIFPARKCHSKLDFFVKLCKQKAIIAGEIENSVKLNVSQRHISCLLALILRSTSTLCISSNTVF